MRARFASVLLLVPALAAAQAPALTVTAALDEAVAANPELVALRLSAPLPGAAADRDARARAAQVLAEVRRAFVELAVARGGLALYETQAPVLLEMVDAGSGADGDMRGHDSEQAATFARVAGTRVAWRERLRLAEIRFAASLGRPFAGELPALAPVERTAIPADAEAVALARDPRLAEARAAAGGAASDQAVLAARARRDAAEVAVRRQVLDRIARLDAARERLAIAESTLVPSMQAAHDTARLGYAAGRAPFRNMVESYHRLLEARFDQFEAGADLDRARVELDIVMGEPTERLAAALTGAGRK
jgi:outer membrane protein TolC